MSEIVAIASSRPQPQLRGYSLYRVDGIHAYVREHDIRPFVLSWNGDRAIMSEVFAADMRSVDSEASCFCMRVRNREDVADAVRRGLALPVMTGDGLLLDADRRPARDW
ncbi:hypothetical protein QCN27_00665 [Cereibacter sp. SYSU M97828]|nr:hypothetical protein [Cereibacter flavus]